VSVDWTKAGPDAILAHLQDVDDESFELLLENESFNEDHVRVMLKDPGLSGEIVERLSREARFFRRGNIRVALVVHPHISRVRALELVPYLFWRDSLRVARNLRVHPQVRLIAEQQVAERIADLTVGEKITLARTATRTVLQALRRDDDLRVAGAVLQNYRCTEEDVLFIANGGRSSPQVLGLIARHPKWRVRPGVRGALIRNRRLPLPVALGLLEQLSVPELEGLARQPRLPRLLRESARRLAREQKLQAP
jgi:hypothetical protein